MSSEIVKIVWSGLTGRVGQEALSLAQKDPAVEIVGAVRRQLVAGIDYESALGHDLRTGYNGKWWRCCDLNRAFVPQPQGHNIVVDFSHPDAFGQVLELAVRTHVPLISGTSGLSDRQMATLYDATNKIPVFRGGNFRFKVKKFIDEAVELAKSQSGNFILYESFYEGKKLPSETSKVIQRKIQEATGKTIDVCSVANLPKDKLPCDWKIDLGTELRNNLHCHTEGFGELAHDVLEIAKVMVNMPVKPGDFYDLDSIWDALPH